MSDSNYLTRLRDLAEWLETQPDLTLGDQYRGEHSLNIMGDFLWFTVPFEYGDDHLDVTNASIRALRKRIGGSWNKEGDDYTLAMVRSEPFLGFTNVQIRANRDRACERVQVRVDTVVIPASSEETVIETPVYEWVCSPAVAA